MSGRFCHVSSWSGCYRIFTRWHCFNIRNFSQINLTQSILRGHVSSNTTKAELILSLLLLFLSRSTPLPLKTHFLLSPIHIVCPRSILTEVSTSPSKLFKGTFDHISYNIESKTPKTPKSLK